MPLDLQFIDNAISMVKRRQLELIDEMKRVTGVKNPNSGAQLLPWLTARGYPFTNLTKDRVALALRDFELSMTGECFSVLKMRLTVAKASVKKFITMRKLVGADGMLRFAFQMSGAGRTNRFAGRGVQLHNLTRPAREYAAFLDELRVLIRENDYETLEMLFSCPIEAISSCVRSAISPIDGSTLVVSDLGSIETRVAAELSNCDTIRQIFRKKLDVYKDFASAMFNKPYDEITKDERQIAKPPVLGGFYGLSGGAEVGEYPDVIKTGLLGYAAGMGVSLTREQSSEHIRVFRDKYHEVPVSWSEMDAAMLRCMSTKQPQRAGIIEFDILNPFLRIKLPSGRYIYYLRPRVGKHTIKPPGKKPFTKIGLSYEGYDLKKKWTRINTHAGKVYENADQSIAFDILAEGMLASDAEGFDIRGHVHDEQITLRGEFDDRHTAHELEAVMARPVSWLPSMPLAAEGYEGLYYRKG